jgi:3-hydroxyacyl-[acyl-carrier-protein] dehydratase
MSVVPSQTGAEGASSAPADAEGPGPRLVLDLSKIDLKGEMYSREDVEKYIPHRGGMLLLDSIIWESADHTKGVAVKRVRSDEFWVPGHFPDRPMMPAVFMIEAGAQLACFLYNIRMPRPQIIAFIHLNNASFRSVVQPGDDLYLLCSEVKFGRRRFVSDIQGISNGRLVFSANIGGMNVDPDPPARIG